MAVVPASRLVSTPVPARTRKWLNDRTLTSVLLLGWWLVQMIQQLNPSTAASTESGGVVVNQAANAVQEGSLANTVLVVSFAALGAWHLRATLKTTGRRAIQILAGVLALYLLWAGLSLLWSVDQTLSVRRLAQLGLLIVGCVGLGAGFYGRYADGPRMLMIHFLVAGASAMATLWLVLLSTGSIDLLNPAFAAKTLGLGTVVAHPIAYSLFAIVYLWRQRRAPVLLMGLYLMAGLLALFAQKVRFITAYSGMLLFALLVVRVNFARAAPWLVAAGFAVCVGLAVASTQDLGGVSDTVYQFATLDSGGRDLQDLSGRAELWSELQHYVDDRPIVGYGFGAFWNPDDLRQVQEVISWAPVVAHNGFLDETLATGYIGAGLCVLFWVIGLSIALVRARAARDDFAAVVACLTALFLLFNWGDSIMQAYFRYPFYASLVALFTLAALPTDNQATP